MNNPGRILFRDDTEIRYTYLSDGTKLEKSFSAAELPPQAAQTTEYSGNIIYRNGMLDKVLFQGSYCTFGDGNDSPVFHSSLWITSATTA